MSRGPAIGRALLVALAVIAADQATKALVRANLERGDEDPILPFVTLVNTRNTGVAFGLFGGAGTVLVVFSAVAIAAIVVFFAFNAARPGMWLPMGLLVGGAAGNLIDRVREGSVTDFIDLPAWPAFNLADVAITFGVLAMIWVLERPRAPDRPA